MAKKNTILLDGSEERKNELVQKFQETLFNLVSNIPKSKESVSINPGEHCKTLGNEAAIKAAMVAGTLAIPPGPFGLLTIIPDLIAVWKIQSQVVADIAAVYGKTITLSKEQMIYCLFKHAAGQLARDLVVRVGQRVAVRRVSLRFIQQVLQKIGVRILQRSAGRALARWIPLVGAAGIGAYAYWDTANVAKNAVDLFSKLEDN
jgi:uncharacterized protein (DUF697 family)